MCFAPSTSSKFCSVGFFGKSPLATASCWGVIAMIVQLLIYVVARFAVPQLAADITAGKPAAAVSLAAASLGIGILNAACMTY